MLLQYTLNSIQTWLFERSASYIFIADLTCVGIVMKITLLYYEYISVWYFLRYTEKHWSVLIHNMFVYYFFFVVTVLM